MAKVTLPAGKYWIGDLCYVMHNYWDEFCSKFLQSNGKLCRLDSGVEVWFDFTPGGDGEFPSNIGEWFCVDGGMLGIIKFDDIIRKERKNLGFGYVHDFLEPFSVICIDGTFYFGDRVSIYTKADDMYGNDWSDDTDDNWDDSADGYPDNYL